MDSTRLSLLSCLIYLAVASQHTVTLAQSDACYGLLQTTPSDILAFDLPSLTFSSNNSLYIYTSLFEKNITCEGGPLHSLRFCYNPHCGNDTIDVVYDTVAFYVLLLKRGEVGYGIEYVHEEVRNAFCDVPRTPSSFCCCKSVGLATPIEIDSSYALGVLIPENAAGEYVYGIEGESPGVVLTPPPFDTPPTVGVSLSVPQENITMIPQRLLQMVIETEPTVPEPTDGTNLGEVVIDFINNNVILVGGAAVLSFALLFSFLSVLFVIALKVKHNLLKKKLKKKGLTRRKSVADKPPKLEMPNPVLTEQYELMEGEEGYIQMVSSPATPSRSYSFRVPHNASKRSLRREGYSSEAEGEEFLVPAKDENELYAQCKWLNLKHIPRTSIDLGEELGSGQFGTVVKGKWHKVTKREEERGKEDDTEKQHDEDDKEGRDKEEVTEVAVKMLKEGSGSMRMIKFLREAAIMGQFSHPNVVTLHGVATEGEPKLLILELLSGGDLSKELVSLQPKKSNEAVESEVPHTLLSYCRQVASGMTYLSNKAFVHRDLAARNILLSEDGSCKIADFGMARDLIDENYYITQGGRIPVKWTAPERERRERERERREKNLAAGQHASDVWSFGVVMYEIWSLGHQPFEGYNNAKTMESIEKGVRMPPPPGCPKAMYSLMIQCWHPTSSKRPSFPTVLQQLSLPDTKLLKGDRPSSSGETKETPLPALGDNLNSSVDMFKELQEMYKPCTSL